MFSVLFFFKYFSTSKFIYKMSEDQESTALQHYQAKCIFSYHKILRKCIWTLVKSLYNRVVFMLKRLLSYSVVGYNVTFNFLPWTSIISTCFLMFPKNHKSDRKFVVVFCLTCSIPWTLIGVSLFLICFWDLVLVNWTIPSNIRFKQYTICITTVYNGGILKFQ